MFKVNNNNIPPSCWFSLNNSKIVKAVRLTIAALSNISLKKFMPNLESLTDSSLQILDNTQTGVFPFFLDFWSNL